MSRRIEIRANQELPGIEEAQKALQRKINQLEAIENSYREIEAKLCLDRAGVVLGKTLVRLYESDSRAAKPRSEGAAYIPLRVLSGGRVEFARALADGRPSQNRVFWSYQQFFEIIEDTGPAKEPSDEST